MTNIRNKIDELIEELYLATLPEEAIRKDLLQFLDTCDRIGASVRDERKRQELNRRIETFKALALRIDKARELAGVDEQFSGSSPHDIIAHRAARMKLLVLDALRAVDASVAEQIEQQRFPVGKNPHEHEAIKATAPRQRKRPSRSFFGPVAVNALVRASYALLAGATLFIIGYRLFR